ncbi:MAG TPA: hypothetical protein PLT26_06840 [Anaerolineaceae bacterium]|mgnify:CR=1 FL=1|nr:hypothetical protein [Anaerolineaceae bacterium]HQH84742.1 hypothetical protein [Anaerolineaceae bacterium]
MSEPAALNSLIAAVTENPRYAVIHPGLVAQICAQELTKGRSTRETVKAARSRLHQIGGAYQETPIGYAQLAAELAALPAERGDPALQALCRKALAQHASTRERLPLLERFFNETLAAIAPVRSVLDLACGLTPLALPWMPLLEAAPYAACDIYTDQMDFINTFFQHLRWPGEAFLCDLSSETPARPVHLALLLKTIPCLEHLDKTIGPRLLAQISAEHVLVSFPERSLGGHARGMGKTYEAHFQQLIAGQPWQVRRFEFSNELAFLLSRS